MRISEDFKHRGDQTGRQRRKIEIAGERGGELSLEERRIIENFLKFRSPVKLASPHKRSTALFKKNGPGDVTGIAAIICRAEIDYQGPGEEKTTLSLIASEKIYSFVENSSENIGDSLLDEKLISFEFLPSITLFDDNSDPFGGGNWSKIL